jgi:hypothetical protein
MQIKHVEGKHERMYGQQTSSYSTSLYEVRQPEKFISNSLLSSFVEKKT